MEVYSMDCNIIKCTCIFRGCVCETANFVACAEGNTRSFAASNNDSNFTMSYRPCKCIAFLFIGITTFICRCTFIHARKDRKRKQQHIFSILGNSKRWKEHTLGLLNKFLPLFLEKSIKAERRRWKTVWIANRQLKN